MNDPRKGVPSASAFSRYLECPASFLRGKEAKEKGLEPPAGEDASSGTRIHRWLETESQEDFLAMSVDEQAIAGRCKAQATQLIDKLFSEVASDEREVRMQASKLGICGPSATSTREPVFTGQADRVLRGFDHHGLSTMLVIDYKTGRGDVDDAKSNEQLCALAALNYAGEYNAAVAIIQPSAGEPSFYVHSGSFVSEHLDEYIDLCQEISDQTKNHKAIAGKHCQYCSARAVCAEFREYSTKDAQALAERVSGNKEAFLPSALELPNDQLANLLRGRRAIGWYLSAIEAAARIKLEKGEEIPGFQLVEKVSRRKITDPAEAANRAAPLLQNAEGGSASAIIRCATISPRKLQEEIHLASGMKTATRRNLSLAQAKAALESAMGEVMVESKTRVLQEIGVIEFDDLPEF